MKPSRDSNAHRFVAGFPARRIAAMWLAALVAGVAAWFRLDAAEAPPQVASLSATNAQVTAEYVAGRLTALSNRTDVAVGVLTNALALYTEAAQRLGEARRLVEETRRLHLETTNAPAVIAELQALAAAPAAVSGVVVATNAAIAELEQQLARADADLAQATKDQDSLSQEPARRATRLAELTRLISDARSARERGLQELGAVLQPELEPEVRQATRDLLQARLQFRDAEQARYEEEQANLNVTADVARLRLDLVRRRVASLAQERDLLTSNLNRRREQASLQASLRAAEAARRAEALNEPWVLQLAQTNSVLARERTALAERLKDVNARLDTVASNRVAIRDSFQGLRERVEAAEKAGLSRNYAIGLLLRRQQALLQGQGDYRSQAQRQQGAISDAQIAQFTAVDARRQLEAVDAVAATLVARFAGGQNPERVTILTQEVKTLLMVQRDLLGGIVRDYDAYLGLLFRLQSAMEETAGVTDEFSEYLDRRVLWIRSAEPLNQRGMRRELVSIWTVFNSADWSRSILEMWNETVRSGVSSLALALGTAVLLILRRFLKRRISEVAVLARQGRNTSIAPTLLALFYILLRASPIPLVFYSFSRGVGDGVLPTLRPALEMVALLTFVLSLLREVCGPDGLAVAHFRMSEGDAKLLRRSLAACLVLVPALGFLNRLLEDESLEGVSNRLIFIPTTLTFAILAHLILRPGGGLGSAMLGEPKDPRGPRVWRRCVHLSAVLLPMAFALASAIGYNYSARHLWVRFMGSVFVALCLKLVSSLLFRWIYLTRRKLSMAHAQKLRAGAGTDTEVGTEGTPALEDGTQSELLKSMEQARRLLHWAYGLALAFSLFGIWSSTLPALQALDRIPVWYLDGPAALPSTAKQDATASGTVSGAAKTILSSGSPSESMAKSAGVGNAARPYVSIWDLLLVVLTVLITLTAAANLPGFLEMAVFSHAQLERGTSYAISSMLRYAIILVGIVSASKGLGLAWSQVQWLAAAVSLGIGFGLQEIFANFVSGLILLFERPVRVGDVVTVGDTSGVVTRIQIRATTIRDWDNRELILPNKDLITGRFLNWTLTDSVTRIVCNVGIAYGSDVRLAQKILIDIARRHPAVLADPPPFVVFEGFGEGTLNLSLRCHVARTDQRASSQSEINLGILDEFEKAGIDISYPRRELHVRSWPTVPGSTTGGDAGADMPPAR